MGMAAAGRWWVLLAAVGLTGCDQLGLETPAKTAERQIAEAKAIGGACRHALRAIEDCYILNAKADKSSMFAGWREMDEYMRENKLEGIEPVVPRPAVVGPKARAPKADEDEDTEDEVVESETTAKPDRPTEPAPGQKSTASEGAGKGEPKPESSNGTGKPKGTEASGVDKPASAARP